MAQADALLLSGERGAPALAEKLSQAYARGVLIGEALRSRHSVLVAELKWER
jgi:hypothetical protein